MEPMRMLMIQEQMRSNNSNAMSSFWSTASQPPGASTTSPTPFQDDDDDDFIYNFATIGGSPSIQQDPDTSGESFHYIPSSTSSIHMSIQRQGLHLGYIAPDFEAETTRASTGRQCDKILRVIDSLQLGDANKITTPANWTPESKVIVHPSVSTEKAREIFPNPIEAAKPYLRLTTL
ncbi:hypothetical protein BCR35DRAFT_331018 [Leucosporidium creatinivorum]|uniref:Peroxiredoxin C-terminal domain-containing protein n=1 Tax=Leucosporidium creatinivorum TaxID=106004 RepID=A0A1Y2FJF4_9BASI|nr:hypothetical protein BCR35DRAFT_331018 [Leucosporidium creatinivorum]